MDVVRARWSGRSWRTCCWSWASRSSSEGSGTHDQLGSERARTIVVLMLLSVSAMAIPSFTHWLHTPAAAHETTFSVIVSILLLALFALSLPFSLRRVAGDSDEADDADERRGRPLCLARGPAVAAPARPRPARRCRDGRRLRLRLVRPRPPAGDGLAVGEPDLRRTGGDRDRRQRDRERGRGAARSPRRGGVLPSR